MYFHDICGAKLEDIDNITECPECLCPLTKESISKIPDGSWVKAISTEESFIEAITQLYEKDPIEYQLKIQQFKTQVQQQKQIKESNQQQKSNDANVPKCPTCGSSNIEKISLTKKAFGGAMFGLFSSNVRKTMHCKNCGYKW